MILPKACSIVPVFSCDKSYSIIIQCSESFSLEKLYFRLNGICGILQLYDPAQGLQHSACFFFIVTKTGRSANKRGGPVSQLLNFTS